MASQDRCTYFLKLEKFSSHKRFICISFSVSMTKNLVTPLGHKWWLLNIHHLQCIDQVEIFLQHSVQNYNQQNVILSHALFCCQLHEKINVQNSLKVVLRSKKSFPCFFRFWKRVRLTPNWQTFELWVLSEGCLFWV